jgi:GTPase involved in cell partitioning and DNA repair
VADLSRFEQGIHETIELFEEIVSYLKIKFWEEDEMNYVFREEDWYIVFEVDKDDEVLLTKKVVLVLNKWDLLNDEEILKEYKKTFFSSLNNFLKEKW